MFNNVRSFCTPSKSVLTENYVCANSCSDAIQTDQKYSFFTVKMSQNKSSKFKEMEKGATFLTLPRTEDRGPRTEDRGPGTEDSGLRTADREPRTEDRGPRTEDRGSRTEDRQPR